MSAYSSQLGRARTQLLQDDYRRRSQFLIGSLYGLVFFSATIVLLVQFLSS